MNSGEQVQLGAKNIDSSSNYFRAGLNKVQEWLEVFFLKPASARPLAILRMGLVLVLIVEAFMLRTSVLDFLAQDGFVQGDLARSLSSPYAPKISWLAHLLAPLGVSEVTCIFATCWAYLVSLVLMGIGLWTRPASVAAWFLHWTLTNSGSSTTYGIDLYAHVFLFYLMWMPIGDLFSVDSLFRKKAPVTGSPGARLGLRVLQLHLCIAYFFSGLEKAQGVQWWNGELLWRALTLPVYRQFDMTWLAQWPLLSKFGGWTTLVMEIGYCVFIWPKMTRKIWVLGIVGLHLGIAIFLGLGLFGAIMCVLTLCVFGISAEPTIVEGRVSEGIETRVAAALLH